MQNCALDENVLKDLQNLDIKIENIERINDDKILLRYIIHGSDFFCECNGYDKLSDIVKETEQEVFGNTTLPSSLQIKMNDFFNLFQAKQDAWQQSQIQNPRISSFYTDRVKKWQEEKNSSTQKQESQNIKYGQQTLNQCFLDLSILHNLQITSKEKDGTTAITEEQRQQAQQMPQISKEEKKQILKCNLLNSSLVQGKQKRMQVGLQNQHQQQFLQNLQNQQQQGGNNFQH